MSVHGVGPSLEFVPGPPSQSTTTRTTPDSGLGGDDRAMRVPPPGFNTSHPMYAPQMMPGPPDHYSGHDYKPNGTVYFQPHVQQDYRMPLGRGQQNMPQTYPDETYGNPQGQGDYHSNPNPNGFASGPPMSLPPSNAMLNQSAASLHQQSGYYWENHALTTPRQPLPTSAMPNHGMNGGYDGDLAIAPQQNQQYLAPHNFHQPPPVTPTSVYQQQQQHSFMMQNGHPASSPVMVQQVPVFLPHGYPSMVQSHTGMFQPQMYLPTAGAPLMLRQGGPRAQEQQQFAHPVVHQYYPVPPPVMNTYGGPVMGFSVNQRRFGNNRRGGYMHSNGRYGRHTPSSVQSESRSESVRSDMNAVNENAEDILESLADMQVKESTTERELSPPNASNDYKLRQKPVKQMLQLASDTKPERVTPSPPKIIESVNEKTTSAVEQESAPSEPEPPKKSESSTLGCWHCKNNKKADWTNHKFKEHQKIVCEDAKKTLKCNNCHNIGGGENAHTAASCPYPNANRHASSTPARDRSSESYPEVSRERPRGLMDQNPIVPYDKTSYPGRGGNPQYRNYGPSNRDRDGGYQRDGYRGRYNNRGPRHRGSHFHGKSDREGAYNPVGSSGAQ